MLVKADRSALVVIDIQDKLAPAVAAIERVVANVGVLIAAATRLGVPVLVSEQYPKGLGSTVKDVSSLVPEGARVAKVHFSCMGDEGFARRFKSLDRRQVVLAGIEAHVCVLQTAVDLLQRGFDVFVVGDATSSRTSENHRAALRRLSSDGVRIVTTEMVLFEWLERAGTPEFKELSRLIR